MSLTVPSYRNGSTPTVLLVHGAFTDASSWARVIPVLEASGIDAVAPANPLRDLAGDAAYLAGVAAEIDGPVLLAGHDYGGAAITAAAARAGNAVGLVYIAAFAPDEGESIVELAGRFAPSLLYPALRPAPFSDAGGSRGVELAIKRDDFARVFAADLPEPVSRVLGASQRPIVAAALEAPCPAAAWRTLPSWYAVATADQVIEPNAQRFMAARAGARCVEVAASHALAVSQPEAVAGLIRVAAAAPRPSPPDAQTRRTE